MVTMPDGAAFEMEWKSVRYANRGHDVTFEIGPMAQGPYLVEISDAASWGAAGRFFSAQERQEILFLLERIAWKRDLRVVEAPVAPQVDREKQAVPGSLESTPGYRQFALKNLFDPDSPLQKEQVKEIYCVLEQRFAQAARGRMEIPRWAIVKGSVLEAVSIPALKQNPQVQLYLS